MKETPHETLLERDASAKAIAKAYGPQLDLLTDMVNYASNLIPRACGSSEKNLRDLIVCWVLLKQFAWMIDAVEVLAWAGAVHAAFVPARVAFEASRYLEWVLASDGEKRAAYFFGADVRAERAFTKKLVRGSDTSWKCSEEMARVGANAAAKCPAMEADARKRIAAADRFFSRPEFAEADAAFEAIGGKLEWYKALGKRNIRAIAEELKRLPEYNICYHKASEIVYSAARKQHVGFASSGAFGHPIRNLAGVSLRML